MDDMLTWGNWNFYDLTHANSVRLSPDGNQLIISVRHTNEVIALNRDTGTLAWRSSDYIFSRDFFTGFSHQHDAQTMTLVWEYSVDHYQPNRGSARRTADGNALIN